MLSDKLCVEIENTIKLFLLSDISLKKDMMNAEKNKEVGHALSSRIEELVYDILDKKLKINITFDIHKNGTKKGEKRDRSLADGKINNHLSNVKFGVNLGQPNMCSMRKIFDEVFDKKGMDSYYIIWIKYMDSNFNVKVFDLLSNFDFITYNDGPGQIMLKEHEFFKNINKVKCNDRKSSLIEKRSKFFDLYESKVNSLINSRQLDVEKRRIKA